MNSAMRVTVWFEISGISIDELRHAGYCLVGNSSILDIPEISNHTVTRMAKFIYRYTRDLQPHSNPHGEVHLQILPEISIHTETHMAKLRVTVWFDISGISKDELRHAGYCGVGDLRYICR
jgi:hypothetical protein